MGILPIILTKHDILLSFTQRIWLAGANILWYELTSCAISTCFNYYSSQNEWNLLKYPRVKYAMVIVATLLTTLTRSRSNRFPSICLLFWAFLHLWHNIWISIYSFSIYQIGNTVLFEMWTSTALVKKWFSQWNEIDFRWHLITQLVSPIP